MIIAIVRIPQSGPKPARDAIVERSIASTEIYRDVRGLRRKYYLNGETSGGGVYEFDSREAAEAWFHDGWADWMEGRFGVRPTVELFDNPVVLDNEKGEVRVDGRAIEAAGA
jgi:accessory colonization factor AcfC